MEIERLRRGEDNQVLDALRLIQELREAQVQVLWWTRALTVLMVFLLVRVLLALDWVEIWR